MKQFTFRLSGLLLLSLFSLMGCSNSSSRGAEQSVLSVLPAPKYEPRAMSAEERARFDSSARVGSDKYLEILDESQLSNFGFSNRQEMQRVQLGTPIEVVGLWGDGSSPGLHPTIIATGEVMVPMQVDGENRVFLSLFEQSGADGKANWDSQMMGSAQLAQILQDEPEGTILFSNTVMMRDYLITPDSTKPQSEWKTRPVLPKEKRTSHDETTLQELLNLTAKTHQEREK